MVPNTTLQIENVPFSCYIDYYYYYFTARKTFKVHKKKISKTILLFNKLGFHINVEKS